MGAREPEHAADDRAWIAAAALLAAAALVARVHNAFAFPALLDFDGAAHALNSFAVHSGRLPDPRSWSGFHPPLAYVWGALLWTLTPPQVPLHAALRLGSALAGALTLALVARVLWRRLPRADAAAVCALALSAPVTAIAMSMIGNEMLCALLVTASLAWLLGAPGGRPVRHASVSGILSGAATLTKSTGLVAVGAAGLTYLLTLPPRRALAAAALVAGVAGALVAPHYLRLVGATGELGVISGTAGSSDARAIMRTQPPGERHLGDYLRLPLSTFLSPFYLSPGMVESVPGLLYASTWADAHGQLLPPAVDPAIPRAESATSLGGLLPTALLLWGGFCILRRPDRHREWRGPLLFAGALAVAFLLQTWLVPRYSAVKASYLLPALLPACYVLGVGLISLGPVLRTAARLGLLLLAAGSTALTWYGWWS